MKANRVAVWAAWGSEEHWNGGSREVKAGSLGSSRRMIFFLKGVAPLKGGGSPQSLMEVGVPNLSRAGGGELLVVVGEPNVRGPPLNGSQSCPGRLPPPITLPPLSVTWRGGAV